MIIVKLSGGLGNQLFQYSFGRYLSLKYATDLKFDIQLTSFRTDFTPRQLGLSSFNITLDVAKKEDIQKFKIFNNGFLSQIERKIIERFPLVNQKVIIEKPFQILKESFCTNHRYYDGYWQSRIYADSFRQEIQSHLIMKESLDVENQEIANEILKSNAISLHIRRGDYISVMSNSKIFAICPIDYYQRAINFFKGKFTNPIFYIFSDDIDWVRNNFSDSNFKFVDINRERPHFDLHLMSLCSHNIIANSSFSWWGAWLNKNEEKIVIYPKVWYLNKKVNDKAISVLMPNTWLGF